MQLKRRHDLVPNLVETVKGYAAHERATLEAVTEARGAAEAAGEPGAVERAEAKLTSALGAINALAEAYPELRAAESFQRLQAELAEIEDEIQASRRIYNANVQHYNTSIQVFPTLLIASPLSFRAARVLRDRGRGRAGGPAGRLLGGGVTAPRRTRTAVRASCSAPYLKSRPAVYFAALGLGRRLRLRRLAGRRADHGAAGRWRALALVVVVAAVRPTAARPPASSTTTRARSGSSTGRARACSRSRRCSARATSAGSSTGCRARCRASRCSRAGSGQLVWEEREEGRRDDELSIGKAAARHRVTICVADLEPSIRRFHGVFLHPRRGLIAPTPDWIGRTPHARHQGGEHGLLAALRAARGRRPGRGAWPASCSSPSLVVWLAEHPLAPGLRDPRRDARGVRGPRRSRTRATSPTCSTPRGELAARVLDEAREAASAAGRRAGPVGFAPHARGADRRVRRSRGPEGGGPAHARAG